MIFAAFAVFLLVLHAEIGIRDALNRRNVVQAIIGATELAAAIICLWLTVQKWRPYVAALAFMGAAKAILFGLIMGTTAAPPFASVPRLEGAIAASYLIAGGTLTLRFATRKAKGAEIAGLILFLLATAAQVVSGTWIPALIVGISGVLAARFWPTTVRRQSVRSESSRLAGKY